MAAQTFQTTAIGPTVTAAFNAAVAQAQYDHGHSGYSGSIAEKREFVLIDVPHGADPLTFANQLLSDGDPRIDDKWGPAGAVILAPGQYFFFGWASS